MPKYRKLSLIMRGCSPRFKEIFERKIKYGAVKADRKFESIRAAAVYVYREGYYPSSKEDDDFIYDNHTLLNSSGSSNPFKETKQDCYV
jgi:hypothetical protein